MKKQQSEHSKYLKQVEAYYRGSMPSYKVIQVGKTPDILRQYGAEALPVVVKQRTLNKSTREKRGSRSAHELSRDKIEGLPAYLENPVFLVEEKKRSAIAIITGSQDRDGNYILVALEMGAKVNEKRANEVKSIYGKVNLKEYLEKHLQENEVHLINKNEAEKIYRVTGFQLPQAFISFDYINNIAQPGSIVNPTKQDSTAPGKQEAGVLKRELARVFQKAGFEPTKKLLGNLLQLQQSSGRLYSIKEIHDIAKTGYQGIGKEEKATMEAIVGECREQERHRRKMKQHSPER